jgi:membrane carboxypeptidase/penicillin-binding protein PbpC
VSPRLTVVAWCGTLSGRGTPALVGAEAAAPLALGLIEELDHPRAGWRAPPPVALAPTREPVLAAPLVIVAPAAGARLLADPDSGAPGLRLPLQAHGGDGGRRWWFDGGAPIGCSDGDRPLLVELARGAHALRVVDAAGAGGAASVIVE